VSGQRALREGEGNGFIWRLFSITRFEEREGGVYLELEAMALSRYIPVSLRGIVDPIVRRISISSLATSLRETERAVRSGMAVASGGTTGRLCPRPAVSMSGARTSGVVGSLR
jgi:hypothetical protein